MATATLDTATLDTAGLDTATLDAARSAFSAGSGYLAACTLGLPTLGTQRALRDDLERWSSGDACAMAYGAVVERVRADYARLVTVPRSSVAIGSQASVLAGMVATAVPDGGEVLCVDGDFSSMVFPFAVLAHRGVTVRHVRLDRLADSIDTATSLIVFSLVQSANGRIADVDEIRRAAHAHGARTLCDITQAAGWMPVDASRFDATICHAYKWLCAPRGVAFLTIAADFAQRIVPIAAGWYAGDDPWESCYGPGMPLARDARRFDVSPAWSAWVGAEPTIAMFADLDMEQVRRHATGLADAFCEQRGLGTRGQAIVSWPDPDGRELGRLAEAGITASGRAGCARIAFHLWNDADDVDRALRALSPSSRL